MRLVSFQIRNYKGFYDSGQLQLDAGFNIIAGQNDAGKSSLLEALGLELTSEHSHRSLRALPSRRSPSIGLPEATVALEISSQELFEVALRTAKMYISVEAQADPISARESAQAFIDSITDVANHVEIRYRGDGRTSAVFNGIPTLDLGPPYHSIEFSRRDGITLGELLSEEESQQWRAYQYDLVSYLKSRIYSFKAERIKAGRSRFGHSTVLEPDIRNLPEVLNSLQGLPPLWNKFTDYVRAIFPHVDHVSVRPVDAHGDVRVLIWPRGISTRDDLAIPLSESGTGIGQVLAMLYVVLAAEQPQIFLIDEPQSFLHPGAARKLIEILRSHEHHQFIIATHSPDIISAAAPKQILLVRKVGSESRVEGIDSSEQQALHLLLSELDVRLSDVFGADRILWVEGRTEELCFPLILEQLSSVPFRGTAILAVSSTGDFDRRVSLAVDIYHRLSRGAGLLPPAIGFVFDAESKAEEAKKRFKMEGANLIEFLPRRMYECYLLDPVAISTVLSELTKQEISAEVVQAWQSSAKSKPEYYPKGTAGAAVGASGWERTVDAATLLTNMFRDLSDNTVEFSKTSHSVQLTRYLLNNNPDALAEVNSLLVDLLSADRRTRPDARPR